ncbi:aminoglycoside phosphotransferase [Bacillus sp. TS-2]|nr:aminoglycoside phosphotransferase [Bacillus sp. TS-2]
MILGKPIASGNTSKIYLSDNKIVKVFKDYFPDSESLNEANKQKYAYSCGLPVPKVLDVTKLNGEQAIIMEYIKGDTLGDLMFNDRNQAENYMNISINTQMEIHRIIPEGIVSMKDKLIHQINSVNENLLNKRKKSYLIKKLESFSYENRLCHGDYHLFNLIKTENQIVIIDWIDSSSGDICADIYRTYLLYSHVSSELAEMYVNLYCEKSGLARSDIFQWAPIVAGARLSENVTSENSILLMKIVNHYC